jgi:hypothetical protein
MSAGPDPIYAGLLTRLSELGYVRPGSLIRRFLPCGKPNCKCKTIGKSAWHGPYFQWTMKRRGKTISVNLSEDQAEKIKEWLKNHREFRKITKAMERHSLKMTDREIQ